MGESKGIPFFATHFQVGFQVRVIIITGTLLLFSESARGGGVFDGHGMTMQSTALARK